MSDVISVPPCPGCHFGCAIDEFQCARGERLHEKWAAGGELSARRQPGPPPKGAAPEGGPRLSDNDRLMHLLHIVGIALSDLERESGGDAAERRIADCLMRQERVASERIIEGRVRLASADLDAVLRSMRDDRLVETRTVHDDTIFYGLTETGVERAETWRDERKAAEADFLAVLSDDEKQQLHDLVFKLLEPGFKRMRR